MLREAIDSIEESAGDADGYELLDAVARMADAGDLCETRLGVSKREHQHCAVERGAVAKRRKLSITLDADDLKSIGHVLVRAKSDAIAMKIEVANLKATAEVFEPNLGRHEALICECQGDLTRIISLAVKAEAAASKNGSE